MPAGRRIRGAVIGPAKRLQSVGDACRAKRQQRASLAEACERDYSLVQIWASEFHKIRNALVHGKPDATLPRFWRDLRSHSEIAVRVFRMCVRERLVEYVPGPVWRGGQPIQIVDIDFDGWVLDERAASVLRRRTHERHRTPTPPPTT